MYKKIVILFLCIPIISFSQQKMTLEECILRALENNLQIKSQEFNNQINKNNLLQSKLDLLPNLNAGASESAVLGRTVDPFTNEFSSENYNSTNFQISSNITLFNGLQKINIIKKSKIDKEKGEYDLEIIKKNITLSVISAYLNILYANDLEEISVQQKQITKQQLVRIAVLVELGKLPAQNQYELEAQLANEELNIITYQNQISSANLMLAQILEIEDFENFAIELPDTVNMFKDFSYLTVNKIYEEALQNMPEIKSTELAMKISEKNLSIARGGLFPRLTFSASYGTGYSSARQMIDNILVGNPIPTGAFITDNLGTRLDVFQNSTDIIYKNQTFGYQIRDNASASFSLNLTIPIFNSYQVRTQVQNSKIYVEQSKYQIEQTKKDLLKEIQSAYSDAIAAMKKYLATTKSLEAIQLSFDYTEARYQQGLVNATDYNVAKNNLTKAYADLLKSKFDFIFKQKILDFYQNKEIKL